MTMTIQVAPQLVATSILAAALSGCGPATQGSVQKHADPAAQVDNPTSESRLTTVTISTEARSRLGIETVAAEKRAVPRRRRLGGELVARPGFSIWLTAPFAGTVRPASALEVGGEVPSGAAVFEIVPLLSAEADSSLSLSRFQAESDLETMRVESDAASAELARVRKMLRGGTGSERALEEAQARVDLTEARAKAAARRHDYLTGVLSGEVAAAGEPLTIAAPFAAVMFEIYVSPGQVVAAGERMCKLVELDRLWIRVPVYAGVFKEIDLTADARVEPLGGEADAAPVAASPVKGPPSADSDAASMDIFYEIDNSARAFRPGQKVQVSVSLRRVVDSLVVPASSILYDIHGGAWVYEESGECTYVRRRVSVRFVTEDLAVLDRGLSPGRRVVSSGSAELFGTEFFVSK